MLIASMSLSGVPAASAASYSFYSLSELTGETFIVGDEIRVQSEFCWTSTKQDPKYPSRIEAQIDGFWKSVGSAIYKKDKSICSKSAYPYIKIFIWKPDKTGSFQMRNREKADINASISVTPKYQPPASSGSSGSTSSGSSGSTSSGVNRASCTFNGQKLYGRVYVTDREIFSDFTVYVTDREIFSDISIFKADREIFANKCGLWYFTDREIFSDFTIYVTDREIFSDFTIYVTDREIFAGIKR